jgi:hypothetical protein
MAELGCLPFNKIIAIYLSVWKKQTIHETK